MSSLCIHSPTSILLKKAHTEIKFFKNALGLPPLSQISSSFFGQRIGYSKLIKKKTRTLCKSGISILSSLEPAFSDVLKNAVSSDIYNAISLLQVQLMKAATDAGISNSQSEHDSAWITAYVLLFSYIFSPPGGLWGLVDYFYSPIHSLTYKTFDAENIKVGRQMGEGSYGVVYEGLILDGNNENSNEERIHVILKRMKNNVSCASEMHNVEIYMNRRLQRTAPGACAEFLGIVDVKSEHAKGKLHEGVWLVWKYEGALTLDHYLKHRSFPEKIADIVLSEEEISKLKSKPNPNSKSNSKSKEENLNYELAVVKRVMSQLFLCLQNIHSAGIIHRDIKPSNLIVTENDGEIKLLDLGACVDLRTGFNYVPNETVMDPKYAPPERYVMPPGTSLPFPPDPISSILSPVVWALNTPDRFDLYSAGIVFLQLSIKQLRHDSALENFNSDFKNCEYDLNEWRKKCRFHENDFAILDANGKAGWELACALLQPRKDYENYIWPSLGESRPTAASALRHRFFLSPFTISIPNFSLPTLPSPSLSPSFPSFSPSPSPLPSSPPPVASLPDIAFITSQLSNFISIPSSPESDLRSNRKDKDVDRMKKEKEKEKDGFLSHDVVFHSLKDHVHHVLERANSFNDAVIQNKKNPPSSPISSSSSKPNSVVKQKKTSVNKRKDSFKQPNNAGIASPSSSSSSSPPSSPSPSPSSSDSAVEEDRKMRVTEIEITSVNLMQEIKSLIPATASLALPLALIYTGLDSLRAYATSTYDLGKSTVDTMGPVVASSASLFAFIYVSRLWLRQQRIKSIRANKLKESLSSSSSPSLSPSTPSPSTVSSTSPNFVLSSPSSLPSPSSPATPSWDGEFKDLTPIFNKGGKEEIGLVMEWPSSSSSSSPPDAANYGLLSSKFDFHFDREGESVVVKELEAMEAQMESLERCMLGERTFALQQTRLLTKMESMVLNIVPNEKHNASSPSPSPSPPIDLHEVGIGGHVSNGVGKKFGKLTWAVPTFNFSFRFGFYLTKAGNMYVHSCANLEFCFF